MNCKYCGKSAGFMRSVCATCRNGDVEKDRAYAAAQAIQMRFAKRQHERTHKAKVEALTKQAQGRINAAFRDSLMRGVDIDALEEIVNRISDELSPEDFPEKKIQSMLWDAWDYAVMYAFDDHILTEVEEDRLEILSETIGLESPKNRAAYKYYFEGQLLRRLKQGELPEITLKGVLPFPLAKSERLVYRFGDVGYSNTVTESCYVGGSRGMSVRVCKGVYCRVGGFRGHVEHTDYSNFVGSGSLFVTTKNLFFVGKESVVKIPFSKIAGFRPTQGGFAFMRTNASAKREHFRFNNPWFGYNLISLVASTEFDIRKQREDSLDSAVERSPVRRLSVRRHGVSTCGEHQHDDYEKQVLDASCELVSVLKEIDESEEFVRVLSKLEGWESVDTMAIPCVVNPRLAVLAFDDIRKCYENMGHTLAELDNPEGLGLSLVTFQIFQTDVKVNDLLDDDKREFWREYVTETMRTFFDSFSLGDGESGLSLQYMLLSVNQDAVLKRYSAALYKWAYLVAGCDGKVTESEGKWLDKILKWSNSGL